MNLLMDSMLAIRIAAFAALVPLISRLPIRKLQAWLEPSFVGPFDEAKCLRILFIGEAVLKRLRFFTSRPCLIRGVTLFYFLRRAGMDVSLVFGIGVAIGTRIAKVDAQHAGHCWLSREGKPYLETVDPLNSFLPMVAFHPHGQPIGVVTAPTGSYGQP